MLQNLHTEWLDAFMLFVTKLGNGGMIWILTGVICLFFAAYRKSGVQILLALLFSLLIVNVLLKNTVCRERPCWIDPGVRLLLSVPEDYSFPSGHASASFAAATSLFCGHKKLGAAALVLAVLIAFSRMYLFVHFPTDILAGMVIGVCCALAAGKVLKIGKIREIL